MTMSDLQRSCHLSKIFPCPIQLEDAQATGDSVLYAPEDHATRILQKL